MSKFHWFQHLKLLALLLELFLTTCTCNLVLLLPHKTLSVCFTADTDVEEASPQPDEDSAEDQPEVRSRVVPNTKRSDAFTPEKQY